MSSANSGSSKRKPWNESDDEAIVHDQVQAEAEKSSTNMNKKVKCDRKLNNSETEVLISEVQSRPCLWNDAHSDFKNSLITRKLWEEVGSAIKLPGVSAKKKWKNLKDKYRKLVQQPQPKSGSGGVISKPKWVFFEFMQFTRNAVLPSRTVGSLSQDEADQTETLDEYDTPSTPTIDEGDQDAPSTRTPQPDIETNVPTPPLPPPPRVVATTNRSAQGLARPHRSAASLQRKNDMEKQLLQLEENSILHNKCGK